MVTTTGPLHFTRRLLANALLAGSPPSPQSVVAPAQAHRSLAKPSRISSCLRAGAGRNHVFPRSGQGP